MNKELYQMIFRRKSFHIFRYVDNISADELHNIEEKYKTFQPGPMSIKWTRKKSNNIPKICLGFLTPNEVLICQKSVTYH